MKHVLLFFLASCGPPAAAVITPDPAPTQTAAPTPTASATIATPPSAPSFTLPFHDGTILRVYGVPPQGDSGFSDVVDADITLERFDPRTRATTPLGHIHPKLGGNSGGIYVPFGITRDDKYIVLDAHMGSPGAGGSMVDYGYGVMKVGSESIDMLSTRASLFFDDYDKVVYVGEGDNAPHHTMPGPPNDAVIFVRTVGAPSATPLLAARDTSYILVSADVRQRTVKYRSTHYTFAPGCPRADDAQACATKVITDGTLHVP